jgi:hypothetical protein
MDSAQAKRTNGRTDAAFEVQGLIYARGMVSVVDVCPLFCSP